MSLPVDSSAITHGIQLAVAPVFLLTAVSGMIGAVAGRLAVGGFLSGVGCFLLALLCFLAETVIATRLLNFRLPHRG